METNENQLVKVGEVISFELMNGKKSRAIAVKQEDDGMIFCTVNCLSEKYLMGVSYGNEDGYEASRLRRYLNNEVLDNFRSYIYRFMIPFANGDLIRIPTEKEIFGMNLYGVEESTDIIQWEPMKKIKNRRVHENNRTANWSGYYWLQNKCRNYEDSFVVCSRGYCSSWCDNFLRLGIRPVFKLKEGYENEI